jgi:hypothetical protein
MKTIILTVLFAVAAAPALGCGDGPPPQNLLVTSQVKSELRAAYVRAHPGARPEGPLSGHTYYAYHAGERRFAVATFDGRPRIFSRWLNHRWVLERDTFGTVCARDVPYEILATTWWFQHSRGLCFRVPS